MTELERVLYETKFNTWYNLRGYKQARKARAVAVFLGKDPRNDETVRQALETAFLQFESHEEKK